MEINCILGFRVAVVTGGNKGIGLEICRQLASNNVMVVLTARDEKWGNEAVDNLKASGLSNIVFHQLDVLDTASIASLPDYIKSQFGKLDILVNNAGVTGVIMDAESFPSLNLQGGENVGGKAHLAKKGVQQTYETAEWCLRTNYYGPKILTQALIPLLLLSDSARIVNISSKLGQLKELSNEWAKNVLGDGDGLTEERVDEFVHSFLEDAKLNLLEKKGWPLNLSAYKVSKAALNAYSRILAMKFKSFCINAVSPGFVKTDMSFNNGRFTVEEGAKGPVMLALMPHGGPSGLFFYQMEVTRIKHIGEYIKGSISHDKDSKTKIKDLLNPYSTLNEAYQDSLYKSVRTSITGTTGSARPVWIGSWDAPRPMGTQIYIWVVSWFAQLPTDNSTYAQWL